MATRENLDPRTSESIYRSPDVTHAVPPAPKVERSHEPRPDESPEEIRGDIDATRARLDRTIDVLELKLSPSYMAQQTMDAIKYRSKRAGNNLSNFISDHPLPSIITGIGLTWLIGAAASRRRESHQPQPHEYSGFRSVHPGAPSEAELRARTALYQAGLESQGTAYDEYGESYQEEQLARQGGGESAGMTGAAGAKAQQWSQQASEQAEQLQQRASDMSGRLRRKASHAKERWSEKASQTGHRVSEQASAMSEQMRHQASMMSAQMRDQASRMGRQVSEKARYGAHVAQEKASEAAHVTQEKARETYGSHPMLVGLGILAAGLLAGLAIPSSRRENRLMGHQRDELFESAQEYGEELMERGKNVAHRAAEAAQNEAQEQGLTPQQLKERGQKVAKAAGEAAKDESKHEAEEVKSEHKPQGGPGKPFGSPDKKPGGGSGMNQGGKI